MKPRELADMISASEKKTPVCVFMSVKAPAPEFPGCKVYGTDGFLVIFGDWDDISKVIAENHDAIIDFTAEARARKSALGMENILLCDARIEFGAHIRKGVSLGKGAVIMHGASVNSGAVIGEGAMIDMNSVVGSCAVIGKNVHIGAGAVIAGALEPFSPVPVKICDGAFIGANAVVLEGLTVGEYAVVGAGAVVTENVPPQTVVAGVPAKPIGTREKLRGGVDITEGLRN